MKSMIAAKLTVRVDRDLNTSGSAALNQFLHDHSRLGVRRGHGAVAAKPHRDRGTGASNNGKSAK